MEAWAKLDFDQGADIRACRPQTPLGMPQAQAGRDSPAAYPDPDRFSRSRHGSQSARQPAGRSEQLLTLWGTNAAGRRRLASACKRTDTGAEIPASYPSQARPLNGQTAAHGCRRRTIDASPPTEAGADPPGRMPGRCGGQPPLRLVLDVSMCETWRLSDEALALRTSQRKWTRPHAISRRTCRLRQPCRTTGDLTPGRTTVPA